MHRGANLTDWSRLCSVVNRISQIFQGLSGPALTARVEHEEEIVDTLNLAFASLQLGRYIITLVSVSSGLKTVSRT